MQYVKLINVNLLRIYLSKCYHKVLIKARFQLVEVHIIKWKLSRIKIRLFLKPSCFVSYVLWPSLSSYKNIILCHIEKIAIFNNVNTTIKITLFLIKITLFLEENSYVRYIFFKYMQQLHEKIIQENSNYEKRLFRLQRNKLYIYKIIYIYIHCINDYVYMIIYTYIPTHPFSYTHAYMCIHVHASIHSFISPSPKEENYL